MPSVTIASLTPALKELYEAPIADNVQKETILMQRIESTKEGVVQKAGGKYVDFPVIVGRNGGISFRSEGETLGNPGRSRMKEANVGLMYGYARTRVNGQLFEIAETDKQAFVNAIDQEMKVLEESVKKDQNRIAYGDGTGKIATVSVTSGPATTFTVSDAYWLEIDHEIDILNSAGTLATGGGGRTITNVDYDTGVVTVDSNVTVTATTHFVTRQGNYTSGTRREPGGLDYMLNNAVNLHGITDPFWKAQNTVLNNNLSESAMIAICDKIRRWGGGVTAIFCSLGVRRAYFNLLTQQRQMVNTMEFSGGFSGLKFTHGKDIPVVEDPDSPASTMYFLTEKDLRVYNTKDWHFEDKTGSLFTQVANTDAFDVFMKRYFEFGVRRRNGFGALTGVVEN